MARKQLTDRTLKALKPAPAGKRIEISDALVPGLAVRVTDKGKITFVLVARYPGSSINPKAGYPNPARRALGTYPAMSLEEARRKAREWLELVAKGIDPAKAAAPLREAPRHPQGDTFEAVAETFLRRHVKGQRRARDTERDIRRELIPRWHDRPLAEIKRRDVIDMVEEIVERGTPAMARNVLGHAKALFGWAVARDMLDSSPADRVSAKTLIGAKKPRQRVLTDDELRAVWKAGERAGFPYGRLVQLLLLTGVRLNEAAGARWSEFDLEKRLWTIPAERFKSDAVHMVPLSDDAVALLATLLRFPDGEFLFSVDGRRPVSGFSRAKAQVDKLMEEELGRTPDPWVNHDLRRTVRTRLSELKVPFEIAEMAIGHARKGLSRVYDQHEFRAEIAEALERWAVRLRSIVEPAPPANVVEFSARRGG